MAARDIRNGILTLIILAVGVKLIVYITGRYVSLAAAGDLGKSLTDMGDLFFYGALVIALLLIPFYLSARRKSQ